jgi:HEPN domain-containing protein
VAIDVVAQVRFWRDGSVDDLEAARTLLVAGKIRQAGFFVHLAIEKALKACVASVTRDLPPRSHDLLFLVERSGLELGGPQRDFIGRVQVYCLEGRYPTEQPPAPSEQSVADDLQEATEMIQWLINQLNNL